MDNHYIADAARSWLGTRFHHQGRLKKNAAHKGGVDCLGLLVGVADEVGLNDAQGVPFSQYDDRTYGHEPDGKKLYATLAALLQEVPPGEIAPGYVLLMRFEKNPQHLAIVDNYEAGGLAIIHAYANARAVVRHRLDEEWKARITHAFCYVKTPASSGPSLRP